MASKQKACVESFECEIVNGGINTGSVSNARIDVKLQKCTGYDSVIDIFPFQSEFELAYGKVEKAASTFVKKQLFRRISIGVSQECRINT